MVEPSHAEDATPHDEPQLQQHIDVLQTLLDTLTEEIVQDLSAILVTASALLYGFQQGRTFSQDRLRTSMELIVRACHQATESIENARQQFPQQ